MPAKKTSSAKTRSAKKSKPKQASMLPYGDPLREAIAGGDVQQMRKVAASTRAWLKDISALLDKLEQQINRLSAKR